MERNSTVESDQIEVIKFRSLRQSLQSDRARGTLAVVDQVGVSATNFLSLVAIGRIAGSESLALFSLGFSVLVLLATSIRSLVITPYMVLGKQRELPQRQAMRVCVLLTWIACVIVVLIAVVLWVVGRSVASVGAMQESGFVLLVILAAPCWILREIARQLCMAEMKFLAALALDIFASFAQLAAIAWLYFRAEITESSVMFVVLVTSLSSGLAWLLGVRHSFQLQLQEIRNVAGELWSFGRWGVISQASHVVQGYAVHWILVFTSGLYAAGVYAAASSIVQLANPFINGAGNALIPLFSRRQREQGPQSLRVAVAKTSRIAAIAAVVLVAFTAVFGVTISRLAYGESFQVTVQLLVVLSVVVSMSAVVLAATKAISVLEFPQINCALNFGTMILTIVFGSMGSYSSGVEGAAKGFLCAAIIGGIAKWYAYRRTISRSVSSARQLP